MKIKFNSDDDLPLEKTLELCNMIIVVGCIFQEGREQYPQVFLNDCLYKSNIMKNLTFLKELMLIKQVHQKRVIFATIGIFQIKGLCFNRINAMGFMMY